MLSNQRQRLPRHLKPWLPILLEQMGSEELPWLPKARIEPLPSLLLAPIFDLVFSYAK